MYGLVLIATLVVAGGAIAFIGDRVGTKVGKKKLSLFGLRPRHTSVIVTVVTGVLITLLTFLILAAASENVRVALFGMERLNEEMRMTQSRLDETGEKLTQTNEELLKSQAETERILEKQKALEAEARELADGNALLEEAKATLTAENGELAEKNSTLAAGNEKLAAENGKLTEENEKLTEGNKALEERAEALREGLMIMRGGDITFRAGEIIASGVIEGGRPEAEVRAAMGSLIALANRNSAERLGVADKTSEIWIYTPEYEKATETIKDADGSMVARIVAAGNLVRGEPVRTNIQLFKNSTIYHKNEFIIARPFVLKELKQGEAEMMVMSFLKDVNAAAQAKGILKDPIRGSVGVMEGTQFYDIVQALLPLRGNVVLSAYAREDTDAMGPLRLNLKMEAEGTPQ